MSYTFHIVERDELDGCPVCGYHDFTLQDSDHDANKYVEYFTCNVCGLDFDVIYEYRQTEYSKEAR